MMLIMFLRLSDLSFESFERVPSHGGIELFQISQVRWANHLQVSYPLGEN